VKIGISESIAEAAGLGLGADQVAIVEDNGAGLLKVEHGADVTDDGAPAFRHQSLRVAGAERADFIERDTGGHIAIDEIVGRRTDR